MDFWYKSEKQCSWIESFSCACTKNIKIYKIVWRSRLKKIVERKKLKRRSILVDFSKPLGCSSIEAIVHNRRERFAYRDESNRFDSVRRFDGRTIDRPRLSISRVLRHVRMQPSNYIYSKGTGYSCLLNNFNESYGRARYSRIFAGVRWNRKGA